MTFEFSFSIPKKFIVATSAALRRSAPLLLVGFLAIISVIFFTIFFQNKLGLAYNDARSHLDIGRRVVEGLKPGAAQLGSVWLPLPHILMVPTIWIDAFWHTGLSGAIQSMLSFIATGLVIYKILERVGAPIPARIFGVLVFVLNLNILYLQSTAMTELLLLGTMTIGVYELMRWHEDNSILNLIKAAFWIMLSTLIRYDGWFLFFYAAMLIIVRALTVHKETLLKKIQRAEGLFVLFCTLAGFGIFLWVLWNALIFKDPLYFAFGPYSAHAQQQQLDAAGVLQTKGNVALSTVTYWYAMVFNSGMVPIIFGLFGSILLVTDRKIKREVRLALTALFAPLFFNVLALYLGHSVLFVQNINGNTWFNVRYGIMMMPSIAVFSGYLFHKVQPLRWLMVGVFVFFTIFHFGSLDAVTIDDGRVGSSQKNVSEVSGWLGKHAANEEGFVLISAASHDAIIFSSGLPMKKFIHEGTGGYWVSATTAPDRWARWIVMRTNDENDQTFKLVSKVEFWREKYDLVASYPFADIYVLKPEFYVNLNTKPILGKQK